MVHIHQSGSLFVYCSIGSSGQDSTKRLPSITRETEEPDDWFVWLHFGGERFLLCLLHLGSALCTVVGIAAPDKIHALKTCHRAPS